MVKNNGQIPQYYVENSHPAIIDRDMWELVQIEIERRDKIGAKYHHLMYSHRNSSVKIVVNSIAKEMALQQ